MGLHITFMGWGKLTPPRLIYQINWNAKQNPGNSLKKEINKMNLNMYIRK